MNYARHIICSLIFLIDKGEVYITRSKYNVSSDKSKRTHNNIVFDSELEMKYYRDVVLPQYEQGIIKHFELQKPYELQPKFKHNGKTILPIKYVVDFYIEYSDGKVQLVDTKGKADAVALLKRKEMWYKYPDLDYIWITYVKKFGGWIEYDECNRLRREAKKNKI